MENKRIDLDRPGRENSPVLTVNDILGSGMCAPGLAKWFRDNGVDYQKFKHGVYRICDFEDWNDGYAQQVIAYAKRVRGIQ
ncbi:hypothetical protein AXY1_52 [Achromobacter phage AXY1]|nr:hypothetical protein AXY1_52 [Achromobacter phage AXY1]